MISYKESPEISLYKYSMNDNYIPHKPSKNKRFGNVSFRVDLLVPYAEKDAAKKLGARWDGDSKTWYAMIGNYNSTTTFSRWLKSQPIVN